MQEEITAQKTTIDSKSSKQAIQQAERAETPTSSTYLQMIQEY